MSDEIQYRRIVHIDMDAFFAAIEQRDHPEWRGKPLAVGGGGKRGVVAAASYEARKYGVRSAMPSITAQRLCPQLIFAPHRFDVYRTVSEQVRAIFLEYTDLVEPLSLDEAYLDVTEPKKGPKSGTLLAAEIRARIFETTQLTASAGISINKFLAKVASDINKPNGQKVILPDEALPFLEQLPIERFFGVGKKTAEKMKKLGIFKGADLKSWELIDLYKRFGKAGRHYYSIVRAEDNRPVQPNRIRKSIGAERTYADNITTLAEMQEKVRYLVEKVYSTLHAKTVSGRTVTLKSKTPEFQTQTRSRSLLHFIESQAELEAIALQLLAEHAPEVPAVRLLGVSISNLTTEYYGTGFQLELDFPEGK